METFSALRFVQGTRRSPMDSLTKGQQRRPLIFFVSLNKLLNKHSIDR